MLFTITIYCIYTRGKLNKWRCAGQVVADNQQLAIRLLKDEFHRRASTFLGVDIDKDEMYKDAKICVDEGVSNSIIQCNWDLK